MRGMERRTLIWAVAILLLIGLVGWAWRHREAVPFVTQPLVAAATPFEYGTARVAQEVLAGATILRGAVTGYAELQQLRAENDALRGALTAHREMIAENERLRGLLQFEATYPQYQVLAARVITRDDGGWTQSAVIDRGQAEGLTKYMAVMLPQGVVGFVSDVYPHSARIQFILDPRTAVGGIVQRPQSRVAALVSGNGNDVAHPEMIDIVKEGDIVAGDAIVTSGYGGLYPKGLLIGTVKEIVPDPSGVVKRAVLTPAVDFTKLEEVLVILNASTAAAPLEQMPNLVPDVPQEGVKG